MWSIGGVILTREFLSTHVRNTKFYSTPENKNLSLPLPLSLFQTGTFITHSLMMHQCPLVESLIVLCFEHKDLHNSHVQSPYVLA